MRLNLAFTRGYERHVGSKTTFMIERDIDARENAKPTAEDVDNYMYGNACRCATYQRIRAGVLRAAEILEA